MSDFFDGIVVPAHLAAFAGDGLWGFLGGVAAATGSEPVFHYDPMTYWWGLPPRYWIRGSETREAPDVGFPIQPNEIRPTFRRLLERYGVLEAVRQGGLNSLGAADLPGVAASVLDFQRVPVQAAGRKAVTKYAAFFGVDMEGKAYAASRLVAPYVGLSDTRTALFQARLNEASLTARRGDEQLWAVFAIESGAPMQAMPERVRRTLSLESFDGSGVWVDDFDEYAADAAQLRRYAELVRSLPGKTWIMFGGYFGVLLGLDTDVEVSHGIYYTESKALQGPVGSGPAADRYYVPLLHRFYEPSRALRAIELIPDLECSCPACGNVQSLRSELVAATPGSGKRVAWAQRLQRHFLYNRRREVQEVNAGGRVALLQSLTDTSRLLRRASPSVTVGLGLDSGHLDRWTQALT